MPKYDASSVGPSWTFTFWLAFQEKRKDKVGDLARVVARDLLWPGWRDIDGLKAYCCKHQFSPTLLSALKQAWDEWEAAKRASEAVPRQKK